VVCEPADERAQLLLAVLLRAGFVERPPVARADFLLVLLRDLGEQVAQAVDRAALAAGLRPERFDRASKARRAVRDDHQGSGQAARGEAAPEREPVLF
jgi:hypothetical protein